MKKIPTNSNIAQWFEGCVERKRNDHHCTHVAHIQGYGIHVQRHVQPQAQAPAKENTGEI